MDLIESLIGTLNNVDGVQVAVLFGSRARGQAQQDSDVDLAVYAPEEDLVSLAAALSDKLEMTVDVTNLIHASIPLLEEVLRDGILVYEAPPGAYALWRSRTLAMLEVDRPWFARMRDAWLRRVAEEGV